MLTHLLAIPRMPAEEEELWNWCLPLAGAPDICDVKTSRGRSLLQSVVTSGIALNSKTGAHAESACARETTHPPIALSSLRSGSGQADGSLYWANQTMQMVQIECQQY